MAEKTVRTFGSKMLRPKDLPKTIAVLGVLSLTLSGCGAGDDVSAADDTSGSSSNAGADTCDVAPEYPNGPIEMIVPYAAGGGTDYVARLIGNGLAEKLDTQVNVVNRTGGSGVVGHQAVASADPDGQTLGLIVSDIGMLHWQGLTDLNPEDITAISQVNSDPAGVTVAADAPWETLDELLQAAEENPGELVGSGVGVGGIWHLALAGLLTAADMDADAIRWVPSEGAAPALQELVAGGVDLSTASLAENKTMLEAERVRPLAVMSDEPDPYFPDVPTVEEATGIKYAMEVWRGVGGPAGMDEQAVAELDCHIESIVSSAEFEESMSESLFGITYRNSEEFAEYMVADDAAKGAIMEEAGLTE